MKLIKFTEEMPPMGTEVLVAMAQNGSIVLNRYIVIIPITGDPKIINLTGEGLKELTQEESLTLLNNCSWFKFDQGEENPFTSMIA